MRIGREEELKYLNELYEKDGSQMVILYGQKYMGKTSLLGEFIHNKQAFYYLARPASDREQILRMTEEFADLNLHTGDETGYEDIFSAIAMQRGKKQILIIDEFQYIVKSTASFMKAVIALLKEEYARGETLIILSSSSVSWVENSMVRKIGTAAYEITGFLKLRELSFREMQAFYPSFSIRQCVEAYSILGAVPGLLQCFDENLSIQENICQHILKNGCYLQGEGSRFVGEELRETAVYHTILAALASGKQKLNDLYNYTGFSRAKISVYLKNLMELEIVEKIFSYDTEGRENTMKGVYAIKNRFVAFWFTFLFPHMSKLQMMSPEVFYESFIAEELAKFCENGFKAVCRELMAEKNHQNVFPIAPEHVGEWLGKAGTIDLIVQDLQGRTAVGICNFASRELPYADFEWLEYTTRQAKLEADYIYLFSAGGFDERIKQEGKENDRIIQVDLDGMRDLYLGERLS